MIRTELQASQPQAFFPVDSLWKHPGSLPKAPPNPLGVLIMGMNPDVIRAQEGRTQVMRVTIGDSEFIYKHESRTPNFRHERRSLIKLRENWKGDIAIAPFPLLFADDPINQVFLMEAVPGRSLRERIQDPGDQLNESEKIQIGIGLVEAVEYAHGINIAHLDINPDNTVFDPDLGRVAIVDWGSSGHGAQLQQCHMTCIKPERTPPTSYVPDLPNIVLHPPECQTRLEVDGEFADAYETASTLVQLFWGIEPLVQSVESDMMSLNIGRLREVIRDSAHYEQRQENFLNTVTANLSANLSERTSSSADIITSLTDFAAAGGQQVFPELR